ncbi:MAG TPA: Ig-like domain-containing protein [Gemmatimonadaceae bacterium]|nr:Ig-like domain-containing protein [Gemmatimonadaceae bacterium]
MLRPRRITLPLALLAILVGTSCADPVTPRGVFEIELTPDTLVLTEGRLGAIEAEPRDAAGALVTGVTASLSTSNEQVATITSDGVVQARSVGIATIIAEVGSTRGTSTVVVTRATAAPVASVSVSPPSPTIAVGGSTQLTAIARDANNNVIAGRATSWVSSDTTIARVSATGAVMGVRAGGATVTATVEGAHGSAVVTVSAPQPPPTGDPVLVGAGDIASCNSVEDDSTAKLLDRIAGTVYTLGDNVYDSGLAAEFANCYDPTWGRHKARTKPSIGNHETYGTTDAAGYYDYFGAAAGERGKGYYSYDVGAWHVVVINNMIDVAATSTQVAWLKADLAAHPTKCTLAYWHYPLFSSGDHGNQTKMRPVWQALYDAGADLVLNGHDHDYERFSPQDPNGVADAARGIREFVVGTGGASHYRFNVIQPNSEVRDQTASGLLKLTLHATSYDWEFVPITGQTFTDKGTGTCH